jgi:thymidine kinase
MPQRGRIELVMGPMFAGKSTELLRRIKRLEISGKKCLNIKYSNDNRYSADCISTHDK